MRFPRASLHALSIIAGLLLTMAWAAPAWADSANVVFGGSITPVPPAETVGPPHPHGPRVSRKDLRADESAAEMDFQVVLKMRNFAALQQKVSRGAAVPRGEMTANHYPLEADYRAVREWLVSQGFKITRQDGSRLSIFAKGSVGQIQRALHVSFSRVTVDGVEYTSAVSAPEIPARLSGLLVGINGLQPHVQAHKHLVKPQLKSGAKDLTSNFPPYTPAQIAQAYNANGLYGANINGAGQTIAIVIDTFPNTDDLTSFWQTYNIPQTLSNVQFIQVVPGTLPSPSGEESLDVEWSSSIAPAAKVRVYAITTLESDFIDQAYQQIFDDAMAHPEWNLHQVSLSFGLGERYSSPAQVSADSQYFANLAAAGVTIFASSGDGGSTPGPGPAGDTSGPTQVEYPASDPTVVGVGGTSLTLNADNSYNSESAWNLGGGGVSVFFNRMSWQNGIGEPGAARTVPDISAVADPDTGAEVTLNGFQTVFGGTSWSSPTWAAFCALINQSRANANLPAVGTLGPKLYPLLASTSFNDIVTGNNGLPAGPGYDEVTGIGTPNVQLLAQALVGPQTVPLSSTVAPGANVTFTVVGAGTPTSFQWQRLPIGTSTWVNLSDDSTYSGTLTAALTITGVTSLMSGDQFQCILGTVSSPITTAPPSVLVVDLPLIVTTLAGQVATLGFNDGAGSAAQFNYPSGVAIDSVGNLFIADFNSDTIRKVTPAGVVSTPYGQAGNIGSANGKGTHATFNTPNAVAADASNNLYVADSGNSCIRKITPKGDVTLLAGIPLFTGTADNLNGHLAQFNNPQGIAVDSSGNVYVADTYNYTVRKITPSGAVFTMAGTAGTNGFADGFGTAAIFSGPFGLAVDSHGNVWVTDLYNFVIRKIEPDGTVTTPYGQRGLAGRADGIGNQALFNAPVGLAIDQFDNLYVTDSQIPPLLDSPSSGNNTLRRITPNGVVSTIAGTAGITGSSDGTGGAAQFWSLQAVAVNPVGAVYLCDTFNQTIRVGAVAPIIAAQAQSVTVAETQTASFDVGVAGMTAPTYQWQRIPAGGSSIIILSDVPGSYSGSTTPTLTVSNTTLAMSGDVFQCNVINGATQYLSLHPPTLTVLTGFNFWATGFFSPMDLANPAVSGANATPQNDGVSNLLKYLSDINPTVPMTTASRAGLPVAGLAQVGSTQYLTLTFRQTPSPIGLTYGVSTSTDLINWQSVTPDSIDIIGTDPDTGDPIVQIKVNTQGAPKLFIQLQVISS